MSEFHTSGFQPSVRASFQGQATLSSEPFVESGDPGLPLYFCGGTLSKMECQGRVGEERERERGEFSG